MNGRDRIRPALLSLVLTLVPALAGCTLPGGAEPATPRAQAIVTVVPTVEPTATVVPTPTPIRDQTPQQIYRRAGPAVVTVLNYTSGGASGRRGVSFGSGVIIDRQGYIVTNHHVIEGQTRLKVIFSDGTERDAQLVGADPTTDLAVLKVEGEVPGIAPFGDSSKLEPGQGVVAIGSALGEFTNTITTGIISGLQRDLPEESGKTLEGLIQTDTAINPGNSGGPLLNLRGEVIGINTAVIRRSGSGTNSSVAEGLGFAVPSNTAKVVSERVIAEGRIARPSLGATTEPVTPGIAVQHELQVQQGARIKNVTAGGPADRAGLRTNDVIVAVGGKTVNRENSLSFLLLSHRPGEQVDFTIARGQERQNVRITLAEAQP